tara:strand:+ start:843 stop:998 length:156 start_codon:yes stop_codon:yes gene_type:complete
MIDITKIYSREAVQFFVFLVKNKMLIPNTAGMIIFHTKLLPKYLEELSKKK